MTLTVPAPLSGLLHPAAVEAWQEGEPLVRFDNVSAGYGGKIFAVRNLNLTIHDGQFMGILGPSGSGKTTLLRLILGIVKPSSGSLTRAVASASPLVGYVPQLETVDWNFPVTVEEVVLMGRWSSRPFVPWASREDRGEARHMMERLGIADLAGRHIRELSGGQQQRVFLARALVGKPRLLLLDEPTSGIDIKTRDEVLHLLHDLNHEGITIVMTTHDLNSAAAHLPWVVCLSQRVIAEGPPAEIMTPEVLSATYGAAMVVFHHQGMVFVGESPHEGHDA
ncbi:MAG: metal ABC transporter ATP-binding protein [Dehalococcoidia bacterium]